MVGFSSRWFPQIIPDVCHKKSAILPRAKYIIFRFGTHRNIIRPLGNGILSLLNDREEQAESALNNTYTPCYCIEIHISFSEFPPPGHRAWSESVIPGQSLVYPKNWDWTTIQPRYSLSGFLRDYFIFFTFGNRPPDNSIFYCHSLAIDNR